MKFCYELFFYTLLPLSLIISGLLLRVCGKMAAVRLLFLSGCRRFTTGCGYFMSLLCSRRMMHGNKEKLIES